MKYYYSIPVLFLIISLNSCNRKTPKELLTSTKWRPTIASHLAFVPTRFRNQMTTRDRQKLIKVAKSISWQFKPGGIYEWFRSGKKHTGSWQLSNDYKTLKVKEKARYKTFDKIYEIKKISSAKLILKLTNSNIQTPLELKPID
ncbi:hypothetical protein BKI52_35910 [marine bacterium AO1-C]|nr:hypothetical protein BKI52_35910 [marine bacterium AO1-C]